MSIKNGFISSESVKVFPCAYRGYDTQNNIYNPEAKLNTEASFVSKGSNISDLIKSYIVDWTGEQLTCVIAGYKFELKITVDELKKDFPNKDVYLKIKLDPKQILETDTTKVLGNMDKEHPSSGDLDNQQESNEITRYFTGLQLIGCDAGTTENLINNSEETYTLRILTADGNIETLNELPYIAKGKGEGSVILGAALKNPETDNSGNIETLKSRATGKNSLAANNATAIGENQTAVGQYNKDEAEALFIVGNGTSSENTQTAFKVNLDGSADIQTKITVPNAAIVNADITNAKIANLNTDVHIQARSNSDINDGGHIIFEKCLDAPQGVDNVTIGNFAGGFRAYTYDKSKDTNNYRALVFTNNGNLKINKQGKQGVKEWVLTTYADIDNTQELIFSTDRLQVGADSVAEGKGSFAGGNGARASGEYSVALGDATTEGAYAFGGGDDARALGKSSFAFGTTARRKIGLQPTRMYPVKAEGEASIALGKGSSATGIASVAAGERSIANKNYAVALGFESKATGEKSFAINSSEASGESSFAGGVSAIASGTGSFAFGIGQAKGENSVSLNNGYTEALNAFAANYATANGENAASFNDGEVLAAKSAFAANIAAIDNNADYAAGFGNANISGKYAFAIGGNDDNCPTASGDSSFAGGINATASENGSFAFGNGVTTNAANQIVFGKYNKADSDALFIVGNGEENVGDDISTRINAFTVKSNGDIEIASNLAQKCATDKYPTSNNGIASAAFNSSEILSGSTHCFAVNHSSIDSNTSDCVAFNNAAIEVNSQNSAAFNAASADGNYTFAIGGNKDNYPIASGESSFAGGISALASGTGSFAFGSGFFQYTEARGTGSTALGDSCVAIGDYSLAAGALSVTNKADSFALGSFLQTSAVSQMVVGMSNNEDSDALFIVGNGSGDANRSNALVVKKNGDVVANRFISTDTPALPVIKGYSKVTNDALFSNTADWANYIFYIWQEKNNDNISFYAAKGNLDVENSFTPVTSGLTYYTLNKDTFPSLYNIKKLSDILSFKLKLENTYNSDNPYIFDITPDFEDGRSGSSVHGIYFGDAYMYQAQVKLLKNNNSSTNKVIAFSIKLKKLNTTDTTEAEFNKLLELSLAITDHAA